MYGKKNKKNNKLVIFFLCIAVVVLLFVSFMLSRRYSVVEGFFKDIAVSVEKVVMYPFTSLNKDKNVDQSKSYIIQKNVNNSLEKEIKELKDTLELNKTMTEYDVVNATVLSRNKNYWFQTLTIDKGKSDGISLDHVVVTRNGLLGKINKVSNHSSEIKLITSDDVNYKVSVSITTNNGDTYAILGGYDNKTKTLKVTGVDKSAGVEKGDTVVTSGMGGMFPRGIYIGTVDDIKDDKYNLSKTLYIKTEQDFNNIHYVTVLKEKDK